MGTLNVVMVLLQKIRKQHYRDAIIAEKNRIGRTLRRAKWDDVNLEVLCVLCVSAV